MGMIDEAGAATTPAPPPEVPMSEARTEVLDAIVTPSTTQPLVMPPSFPPVLATHPGPAPASPIHPAAAPASTVADTRSTPPALSRSRISRSVKPHSLCSRARRTHGSSGSDAPISATHYAEGATGTRSGSGK